MCRTRPVSGSSTASGHNGRQWCAPLPRRSLPSQKGSVGINKSHNNEKFFQYFAEIVHDLERILLITRLIMSKRDLPTEGMWEVFV